MATKIGKYKVSKKESTVYENDVQVATFNTLDISGNCQFGTNNSSLLGFYGATMVNQPGAYTQTYSTADKTVANATAAALTLSNMEDGSANNTLVAIGNTSDSNQSDNIEQNFDKVGDEINALIADVDDLRKTVTAIIDDLQELGLVG
jgi:hypothetical protein